MSTVFKMSNSNSKRLSSTPHSNPPDSSISGHRTGADAGVGRSGDKAASDRDGRGSSQAGTSTSISGQGAGTIVTEPRLR